MTTTDAAPYEINCDWLSFTMPIHEVFEYELDHAAYIHADVSRQFPELEIGDHPREKRRGIYSHAFDLGISGLVLFSHGVTNYLIEISGRGCRHLEDTNAFVEVASQALPQCINITRYDLAVDFETDVQPLTFARERGANWKATNHWLSGDGDTFYVGAKKSDRQAKVYRYFPPHERAHLLRVEMTYRKKGGAFTALSHHIEVGKLQVAADMGKAFGWTHPLWSFENGARIKAWRPDVGKASTIRWIRKAVIPALRRLRRDGVLDDNHPLWAELAEYLPLVHDADAGQPDNE